MPIEKFKIDAIKPDSQQDGNVKTAQLVLETDDGFVVHCDSDFPNESLGEISKEKLNEYVSKLVEGNLVLVIYEDSLEKVDVSDRKLEQKEGTYETMVSGEVTSVQEREGGIIMFVVDTGRFTFEIESKKDVLHPKEGEHVRAKGDLRIEDIQLL